MKFLGNVCVMTMVAIMAYQISEVTAHFLVDPRYPITIDYDYFEPETKRVWTKEDCKQRAKLNPVVTLISHEECLKNAVTIKENGLDAISQQQ